MANTKKKSRLSITLLEILIAQSKSIIEIMAEEGRKEGGKDTLSVRESFELVSLSRSERNCRKDNYNTIVLNQ